MKPSTEQPALTRREVLELHAGLTRLKNVKGSKLNYAINRTLASLHPLVKLFDVKNFVPENENFARYQQELNDGYRKLSKGKTNITPQGESYDFDINHQDAKDLRYKLQEKYSEMLAERKAHFKEYEAWLDKPCGDGCEHPEDEEYRIYHVSATEISDDTDKAVWDACMLLITD